MMQILQSNCGHVSDPGTREGRGLGEEPYANVQNLPARSAPASSIRGFQNHLQGYRPKAQINL